MPRASRERLPWAYVRNDPDDILKASTFLHDTTFQLLHAGKLKLVTRCKHLPTIGESRVLRDGLVFLRTQNKAGRGIVVWAPHKIIEHANIAVHLTNIPMGELSHLQVDERLFQP